MIAPMERIRPGMLVMTLDGQHLGHVRSVGDTSFHLVAGGHALEVPAEDVGSVLEHEVFLRLALRRYLPRLQG
jgi:hypothetical protein